MMKTVYDLSRKQLNELKVTYVTQLIESEGGEVYWGDLMGAHTIDDEIIFEHYDGIMFTDDDFTCTANGRG